MRGIRKLAWVEAKLLVREPLNLFFMMGLPVVMLLCFGMIFGNKPTPYFGGYGFVDISVPTYAAMAIAMGALFTLTTRVATYRENGVLRRMRMTTLRPQVVLGVQALAVFLLTAIGMVMLVLVGKALWGLRFPGHLPAVAAGFTLSCFSFFAIALVIASLASTSRGALNIAMIFFYPTFFLSGAAVPRENLPLAVQHYGQILPLTHVVNLLRGLWIGESFSQHATEVAVLAGLLVVGVLVSAKLFRWE